MNIKNAAITIILFSSLCLSQAATAEMSLQEAKEKIVQLENENQALKEQLKIYEKETEEIRKKIEQHEIKDVKKTEITQ